MAFRAVGNKKLCVTRCLCINAKAVSGEKRPAKATIGRPNTKQGSKASINPPVQAQSAGLQNTVSNCGSTGIPSPSQPAPEGSYPNQFWLAIKPVKLPIKALWGINAPFGLPVVPLV